MPKLMRQWQILMNVFCYLNVIFGSFWQETFFVALSDITVLLQQQSDFQKLNIYQHGVILRPGISSVEGWLSRFPPL